MDSKEMKKIICELRKKELEEKRNKTWTKNEIAILRMFYGKGSITANDLAKQLGRNVNSINNAIARYCR